MKFQHMFIKVKQPKNVITKLDIKPGLCNFRNTKKDSWYYYITMRVS